MIENLESAMRESPEKTLGVNKSDARRMIRNMTFAEHRAYTEATVDLPSSQHRGGSTTTPPPAPDPSAAPAPASSDTNAPPSPSNTSTTMNTGTPTSGDTSHIDPRTGQINPNNLQAGQSQQVSVDGVDGQFVVDRVDGNNIQVVDTTGNRVQTTRNKLKSPMSLGAFSRGTGEAWAKFKQGFYKGLQQNSADPGVDAELHRIQELAGVKQVVKPMKMPSVIGNTSDSHKPTSKLRHRLRLQKEKKKD